ncbi:FecCD family ABC transporter permease [Nocardiopsis lambiniae]|uniref:Iron chelate uptake ABC transporter family permease subunit n=1 Tax=Nocardiopsis lambiniae TaxID=3075539 RepID=A0ABU2MCE3_9ACTN|nr:iron chelate uptake ABC transporter family permease subunit [Nocardiopsis sp. DSM 44743]MDT0330235.1 iron chelate uptake ABC transporter family permease subunit [Nocardiopsis sp. DSM 44743]
MSTSTLSRPRTGTRITPRGSLALRLGDRYSVLVRPRTLIVALFLIVVATAALVVSVSVGDYEIPLGAVPAAIAGYGERLDVFFVQGVRLPRALTALGVGAALGLAGAVFQSLSRNALGSPDIIGFTSGAATGAVAIILLVGGGRLVVSMGAIAGGLITAVVVYLLAMKNGVQGYRLVLVGIGVSAMLGAVRDYLLTRAELTDAMGAQIWMIGSLNGRGWGEVIAVWLSLALLGPILLTLGSRLRFMELGDDTARALGVSTQATQVAALIAASALTGAAIAVSGPIGFVALAAPQLARRLTRTGGTTFVGAALMGAALLVVADLVALRALAPTQLPVGVVTAVIGGGYLIWLLYTEWRRGRA